MGCVLSYFRRGTFDLTEGQLTDKLLEGGVTEENSDAAGHKGDKEHQQDSNSESQGDNTQNGAHDEIPDDDKTMLLGALGATAAGAVTVGAVAGAMKAAQIKDEPLITPPAAEPRDEDEAIKSDGGATPVGSAAAVTGGALTAAALTGAALQSGDDGATTPGLDSGEKREETPVSIGKGDSASPGPTSVEREANQTPVPAKSDSNADNVSVMSTPEHFDVSSPSGAHLSPRSDTGVMSPKNDDLSPPHSPPAESTQQAEYAFDEKPTRTDSTDAAGRQQSPSVTGDGVSIHSHFTDGESRPTFSAGEEESPRASSAAADNDVSHPNAANDTEQVSPQVLDATAQVTSATDDFHIKSPVEESSAQSPDVREELNFQTPSDDKTDHNVVAAQEASLATFTAAEDESHSHSDTEQTGEDPPVEQEASGLLSTVEGDLRAHSTEAEGETYASKNTTEEEAHVESPVQEEVDVHRNTMEEGPTIQSTIASESRASSKASKGEYHDPLETAGDESRASSKASKGQRHSLSEAPEDEPHLFSKANNDDCHSQTLEGESHVQSATTEREFGLQSTATEDEHVSNLQASDEDTHMDQRKEWEEYRVSPSTLDEAFQAQSATEDEYRTQSTAPEDEGHVPLISLKENDPFEPAAVKAPVGKSEDGGRTSSAHSHVEGGSRSHSAAEDYGLQSPDRTESVIDRADSQIDSHAQSPQENANFEPELQTDASKGDLVAEGQDLEAWSESSGAIRIPTPVTGIRAEFVKEGSMREEVDTPKIVPEQRSTRASPEYEKFISTLASPNDEKKESTERNENASPIQPGHVADEAHEPTDANGVAKTEDSLMTMQNKEEALTSRAESSADVVNEPATGFQESTAIVQSPVPSVKEDAIVKVDRFSFGSDAALALNESPPEETGTSADKAQPDDRSDTGTQDKPSDAIMLEETPKLDIPADVNTAGEKSPRDPPSRTYSTEGDDLPHDISDRTEDNDFDPLAQTQSLIFPDELAGRSSQLSEKPSSPFPQLAEGGSQSETPRVLSPTETKQGTLSTVAIESVVDHAAPEDEDIQHAFLSEIEKPTQKEANIALEEQKITQEEHTAELDEGRTTAESGKITPKDGKETTTAEERSATLGEYEATQDEELGKQEEGKVTPEQEMMTPEQEVTTPWKEATKPEGEEIALWKGTPEGEKSALQMEASTPEGEGTTPRHWALTPNEEQESTRKEASAPEGEETTPRKQASTPEGEDTMTSEGAMSILREETSTLEGAETTPRKEMSTPQGEEAALRKDTPIQEGEETTPRKQILTPETKETMALEGEKPMLREEASTVQGAEITPQREMSTPQEKEITPRKDTSTPQGGEITPRKQMSTPEREETMTSEGEKSMLREETLTLDGAKMTPRKDTSTPQGEETATRKETSTPDGEETTPRKEMSTPQGEETTPRKETSTPDGEETTPRKEMSTPEGEEATPRKETPTPDGEETTPRKETSTPKLEESTPRNESMTPDGERTTPRKDSTTPEGEKETRGEETAAQEQDIATPEMEETTPRKETMTPEREEVTPKEGTMILGEDTMTPGGDKAVPEAGMATPEGEKVTTEKEDMSALEHAAALAGGRTPEPIRNELQTEQSENQRVTPEFDGTSSPTHQINAEQITSDVDQAATKIQAGVRGWQTRRKISRQQAAATQIQAGFRGWRVRRARRTRRSSSLPELTKNANLTADDHYMDVDTLKDRAAAKIQAGYRGWRTRQEMKSLTIGPLEGAAQVSPAISMAEVSVEDQAAARIQAGYRGWKTRRTLKRSLSDPNSEALVLAHSQQPKMVEETGSSVHQPASISAVDGLTTSAEMPTPRDEDETAHSIQSIQSEVASDSVTPRQDRGAADGPLATDHDAMNPLAGGVTQSDSSAADNRTLEPSDDVLTAGNDFKQSLSDTDRSDGALSPSASQQAEAAVKIQAGYRGWKTRQQMRSEPTTVRPTVSAKSVTDSGALPIDFAIVHRPEDDWLTQDLMKIEAEKRANEGVGSKAAEKHVASAGDEPDGKDGKDARPDSTSTTESTSSWLTHAQTEIRASFQGLRDNVSDALKTVEDTARLVREKGAALGAEGGGEGGADDGAVVVEEDARRVGESGGAATTVMEAGLPQEESRESAASPDSVKAAEQAGSEETDRGASERSPSEREEEEIWEEIQRSMQHED